MSPTEAARLARLEQNFGELASLVSALRERMSHVEELARELGRVPLDVARIAGKIDNTVERLDELHAEFDALVRALKEGDERQRDADERRETERRTEVATERRWRIGLAVVIVLGIVGVFVQIYLAAATG